MATALMSKKIAFIGQKGFSGGLSSENPIAISQDQLIVADNVLVGTAPTRRKRGGMEAYNQVPLGLSANPIRGNMEFWRTSGLVGVPTSDVVIHQDNKFYSIDDRNAAAVDRTGALVLSTTAIPCYQPFNQILYFVSTTTADGYNKWTGVGNAVAATPPSDGVGKYIFSHLGRMVMIGFDNAPFTVWLSTAFEPENWSSIAPKNATSLDLDDNGDPEGITGGCSFQNRLYIFTRKSTYEITGTTADTFVVQRVSNGIGCIGHASIVAVPNDIIFASDRGIHSLRQLSSGRQTETSFISKDIQRLWTELVNASRFKQFQAAYDENINCYVISTVDGSATVNKDMLVYNIEFGCWTLWKDINARSVSQALLNNKKQLLIGRENGQLAYLGVSARKDFGTTDYTSRFQTGILYPGDDITIDKRFLSVTVLASTTAPANIQVSWVIDGKRGDTTLMTLAAGEDLLGSTFILGQSSLGIGQYLPYTFSIGQVGCGIQFDFVIQSVGDVEIYGLVLEVENANPVYGSRTSS